MKLDLIQSIILFGGIVIVIRGTNLTAPDLVLGSKFEKDADAGDLDGELDLVMVVIFIIFII